MRSCSPFLIILFLICFTGGAIAQQPYFSLKTLEEGDNHAFPVFSSKKSTGAATQINSLLQICELRILDGYYQTSIFESLTAYDEPQMGYFRDIAFEVKENTPRLLSVRFDVSSCGATCFYWSNCYNFNAQTGEPIQLADLLTAQGLQTIKDKAAVSWQARIDDALKNQDGWMQRPGSILATVLKRQMCRQTAFI